MSVIIRPATTADIKTIRHIIDVNKASRRMLEKETVTLYETVQEFVVAELNGKFYGTQYEDGYSCDNRFGEIENASISDPRYCTKPEDKTHQGDPDRHMLRKSKLVKVIVTLPVLRSMSVKSLLKTKSFVSFETRLNTKVDPVTLLVF